ncbi:MAG: hypothetical protein EHM49_00140 [Deltaproteobacteria bacterium]|nr:MAG: hypothetical protein EHM49_00140 [Deltaproteobacteria bacterium]
MPGIWSAGGNLITARQGVAGCGLLTAGLSFGGYSTTYLTVTEEYDGTSWASGGDLLTATEYPGGCGTQIAGLCFGGYVSAGKTDITEEYDGTAWSLGGVLPAARSKHGSCGTQTAGLGFGGYYGYSTTNTSIEYDGTVWSSGGNISVARHSLSGCGLQTAGLCIGGYSYMKRTEEYDGTSWATVSDLLTGGYSRASCGLQAAGLCFGGYNSSLLVSTEEYDGTTWTAGGDLSTARLSLGGCGIMTEALSFGGYSSTYVNITEEYGLGVPPVEAILSRVSFLSALGVNDAFSLFNPMGDSLEHFTVVPLAEIEVKSFINTLSDYLNSSQKLLNSLSAGDPFSFKRDLLSSIQSDFLSQWPLLDLSDSLSKTQALIASLSDSLTVRNSLIGELALQNDIQTIFSVLGSMEDQPALYPDCSIEVYLNGVPVTNKIQSLSLIMGRETLFDTLSINSIDSAFYLDLQGLVGSETSYIEVIYKGTAWFFLVEEVSNYERSFSVWGRSIAAAKCDTPFKIKSSYVLETDTLASVVAANLVPELAITWNVVDWMVPEGWTVTGTPVQNLQELASAVGAVIRTYPDGTGLHVEKRYTVRPVDLPYVAAVDTFDRNSNLISLSVSRILGTGENAVTVYGYSDLSNYSINLEADSCTVVGQDARIKVYPALGGVGYTLVSSMGTPVYLYKEAIKQTEVVSFVGGKGSVRYPITDLESIAWDGISPSGFDYVSRQNEITLMDDTVAALGEVRYTTSYDVWKITRSSEGSILIVCVPSESGGIVALVYWDDGDLEAESLDRPILTSIEAAIEAGTAWLDDNAYTKLIRSIYVPCSTAMDGEVVSIISEESNVFGNALVDSHSIEASRVSGVLKVCSNIQAIQFER